jgi:hypothetical protein
MEKGRTTDPITTFEYITRNFHDACLGIKTQVFVGKKNIYNKKYNGTMYCNLQYTQ